MVAFVIVRVTMVLAVESIDVVKSAEEVVEIKVTSVEFSALVDVVASVVVDFVMVAIFRNVRVGSAALVTLRGLLAVEFVGFAIFVGIVTPIGVLASVAVAAPVLTTENVEVARSELKVATGVSVVVRVVVEVEIAALTEVIAPPGVVTSVFVIAAIFRKL